MARIPKAKDGVVIEAIIVDPPVVYPGETATITIHAHNDDGGPLDFTVSASDGTIEPTDEPNVFLWHAPMNISPGKQVLLH